MQRPVRGASEDMAMTQFPMEPIAKLGLLKMDLLGLTNLAILEQARQMVAQRRGVHLDFHQIPLDDQKTFSLLSSGETTGVFQLESPGMRRYVRKLKPTSLGDVAAMIALYRPGPMEHIDTFIDAKHGLKAVRYPHPALKDILEETYGVIVYQDQVLLIAQAFAGYSLGEADVVRKAMGKKIPEVMRQEGEKFIEGALKKGFSRQLAEEVFHLIEPFAGYAFNKAHSVSYALIAYWTAYLKANYPQEYLASVMNAHAGQGEKIASAVTECLRLGIPVLLPDVNRSETDFSIDIDAEGKQAIRFGLSTVKNVGSMAVKPLVEERKRGGPYHSLEDFCRRADLRSVNRRALESLTRVGALDSLGPRGPLLASVERILSMAQREVRLKESGQATMFDLFGEEVPPPVSSLPLEEGEVLHQEKLAWEKDLLGTFISENPLSALAYSAARNAIISRSDIDTDMVGQKITLVGQVSSLSARATREGKPFAVVELGLMVGSIQVMVWPDIYEKTHDLWHEGGMVEVVGRIRQRDDELSVHCDEAAAYQVEQDKETGHDGQEAPPHGVEGTRKTNGSRGQSNGIEKQANGVSSPAPSGKLWIRLEESSHPGEDEHLLREVVRLLLNYPGSWPVALKIKTDGKLVRGDLPFLSIGYCEELHQGLVAMVGEGGVEVEVAP
ncbi:MAG: DNA polymerase III subunit alpha [Chloroflexi bacterium]|nr:DNA polymerase III subunit alpha [Chloroflexota bacterium]